MGKTMVAGPNKPSLSMAERGSLSMRSIKAKNTKPELRLREGLREKGLRGYRIHCDTLPGKPDVCFTRFKVAVFVHGCFFHKCPTCALPNPKTNEEYWVPKLLRNVERDQANILSLQEQGWQVVVLWECEIKSALELCIDKVSAKLESQSKIFRMAE